MGHQILALVRDNSFQLGDFHSLTSGKSQRGFRRLAVFIKGRLFGGPQLFESLVFLFLRNIRYIENQPARGGQTLDSGMADAFFCQRFADDFFHITDGFG